MKGKRDEEERKRKWQPVAWGTVIHPAADTKKLASVSVYPAGITSQTTVFLRADVWNSDCVQGLQAAQRFLRKRMGRPEMVSAVHQYAAV